MGYNIFIGLLGKSLTSNQCCDFSHFPWKNGYGYGHISPSSVFLQFISTSPFRSKNMYRNKKQMESRRSQNRQNWSFPRQATFTQQLTACKIMGS
jgi:hypothetical protein